MPTTVKDTDNAWADAVWDGADKPKARIPTAADVLKRQNERVANDVKPEAGTDTISDYLQDLGGGGGTPLKFAKDGTFLTPYGALEEGRKFIFVYVGTKIGNIKFNGPGVSPETHMGLLYEGFKPLRREELGDLDETQWPIGLSGKRTDPWQSQIIIPLQDIETGELFNFATTSVTRRRAVGNLISQCQRLARTDPNSYPVIVLKAGGFKHNRFGFIKTPSFVVVGKVAKDGATTTAGDEMNDSIPL